jgi:hypothetical protein
VVKNRVVKNISGHKKKEVTGSKKQMYNEKVGS